MVFALSEWPHFYRAYLVAVCKRKLVAVFILAWDLCLGAVVNFKWSQDAGTYWGNKHLLILRFCNTVFFCARSERGAFLWNCQKNAFFAQCRYSASYSMRFKKFSNVSGTAALSTVLVSQTFSICFLTMSKMNFRARIQNSNTVKFWS